MADAGLDVTLARDLAPDAHDGGKLTVSLWMARDRRIVTDVQPLLLREIA